MRSVIFRQLAAALLFSLYLWGSRTFIMGEPWWIEGVSGAALSVWIALFCRYRMVWYGLLWGMTAVDMLFFPYFHRAVTVTDITLFLTHTGESFEALFALLSLFCKSLFFSVGGLGILWWLKTQLRERIPLCTSCRLGGFSLLLLFAMKPHAWLHTLFLLLSLPFQSPHTSAYRTEIPLYPDVQTDYSVVLIIGESMRYDAYVAEQLQKLGFFYRKIYSGATGTDVAVPLLLNVKNDPLQLATDSETNLFRLAKKSGYQTCFVSMQTPKALQYIRPYLQPDHIDSYKSFEKAQREPYYDRLLLRTLQGIDFGHKQFIVMQQIGEHAPYRYFYGPKAEDIRTNYYRGVDESFRLYREVAKHLEERASKYVLIYVSDHGEFIGEGGRYGHNTFAPEIYEVPLFITANFSLPKGYETIASHYDLSRYIMHLLGYGREFTLPVHERTHIINGTMLSREDGFKVVHEP